MYATSGESNIMAYVNNLFAFSSRFIMSNSLQHQLSFVNYSLGLH